MKGIFTLLTAITIGSFSFGQTVFQSDLSTWSGGVPTDWMGTKTSITATDVVQNMIGVNYGTSSAALINTGTSHKRFTTQAVTVVGGESYEIVIYCATLQGEIRTAFFDLSDNTTGPFSNGYGAYNLYENLTAFNGTVTQVVTVPAGCTSAEFILSLKGTDANGIIVDSVAVNVTTPPPPPAVVSIYDIQYTADASGDSPEMNNELTTKGVVTGIYQIGTNADRFFIQDGDGAWNGIYIYENTTIVALGDSVTVTGTVQEFNGLTEIGYVSDITILNSGNTLPTPVVVTSATVGNEEYEGVLVTIEEGINTVAVDQYGVWTINDGAVALIDDDLMPAQYTPVLGNEYSVTGVRHLSFGDVLVMPRDEVSDIITTGYVSVDENELEISIYPNPATTNVTISGIENGTVTIYAVSGEVVYGSKVNGTVTINTEDLTTGVYMIEVIENNVKANYKLIVK